VNQSLLFGGNMAKNKPSKKQEREISKGVEKMVHEYENTGEIKTSRAEYHPEDKKKAIKQALAIEYGEHKVGRAGSKKKA
jgi:hypothetical protein